MANSDGRWIIANWGMGADSTSWVLLVCELLARYRAGDITHAGLLAAAGLPADCDIEKLVVVTAHTGSEWPQTKHLGERHVLPALAAGRVRLVQVARAGRLEGDGVVVLDDSRCPVVLHTRGGYLLWTEMVTAATVPTTTLDRKCSIHAKGWAVDPVIPLIVGGDRYVQVMGFEDSRQERDRALRDARYDTAQRQGVYPLIALGWDRERCLKEIEARTGVADYRKSACTFCPFSFQNKANRRMVLAGYAADPRTAREALVMERAAVACNPRMGLSCGDRIEDLIAATPGMGHVLDDLEKTLQSMQWSVLEVRRATKTGKAKDDKTRLDRTRRGFSARRTRKVAFDTWAAGPDATPSRTQRDTVTSQLSRAYAGGWLSADELEQRAAAAETADTIPGLQSLLRRLPVTRPWEATESDRETALRRLEALADARGWNVDWSDPKHPRVHVRQRGEVYPMLERSYVLVPSVVQSKQNPAFVNTWRIVTTQLRKLPAAPRQTTLLDLV